MFERMWETITYCTAICEISLEREFKYLLLWYIASADWLIKTSTTDVCVIVRGPR